MVKPTKVQLVSVEVRPYTARACHGQLPVSRAQLRSGGEFMGTEGFSSPPLDRFLAVLGWANLVYSSIVACWVPSSHRDVVS